ncbi:MAG: carboxypeptidase-like regulatory domain-containing protein [Saprospiraceae bacterium]|nr:carboxypeptidase-like regulatory domain-containing protein [Saprospiraceae bacterium]
MFRYTFFIVLFLVLQVAFLQAQTQTIRGTVLDRHSEMPLIGATIQLVTTSTPLGTVTDVEGRFELKDVPVGRHALSISYLGYESSQVPNILVTAGKEVVLNIALSESVIALEQVVVSGALEKQKTVNELATISARQFNTEEVLRYSGGRNDIAKLVANFAGVAANNDARNDIIIRGNSPTGVLWRVEGIPMPNPNHFSTLGTTGGPVSALNPNLIAESDFLTGAFPAEYGNALAGVFDIQLRKGNRERYEAMFQLGAFSGLEALIEGPLNPKAGGSFVAAYRHSFVELAKAANLEFGTNAVPRYKDLTLNLDFGKTKAGRFSVFAIGGNSAIDFLASEIDTNDLFARPDRNAYNTSQFGVAGIKHQLLLSEKAYLRSVFSVSHTGVKYTEDDLEIEPGNHYPIVDVSDNLTAYRLSSFYNQKVNSKLTYRTGILVQHLALKTFVDSRDNTPDYNNDGRPDWVVVRDFDGGFQQAEVWVQSQYRMNNKWTLNTGINALFFGKTEELVIEPRLALNWEFALNQKINLGYGIHHQTQPLPVFFYRDELPDGTTIPSNEKLKMTRNQHLILAYEYTPGADWRFRTELYAQWLDKAPVDNYSSSFSILNAGADFVFPSRGSLVNEGTGFNRGVEVTVEKFFSKNYYGLLTASVFESTYKGSDGIKRSTAFDGRYVVNVLAGREFAIGKSGRNFLTLDTKFTTAGGRPFTPVDLVASQTEGKEVLIESAAFSERLDDYLRWDVKFGFRMNSARRKMSQTFFLDLQNVTNNENIFAMRYNPVRNDVGRINQIGFFPDVLYRLEF